jgi:hypothetical protein
MSEKKTYPNMPVNHWYKLRLQLKKSIPNTINANYIASVLGMSEASAKANIIPTLRMIGFIDEKDNTNQEMAKKIRDDSQYKMICQDILKNTFPKEVLDNFPNSDSKKEKVKDWFMNHNGVGSSGAARIVAFYFALLDSNLNFELRKSKLKELKNNTAKPLMKTITADNNSVISTLKESEKLSGKSQKTIDISSTPSININLQIHIPSDASAEQIEKIFESMAKHIYKNK